MLQFANSDSSAESEVAKAESMSRRNHLHDDMRWRAVGMLLCVLCPPNRYSFCNGIRHGDMGRRSVGMLQTAARQSTVARELNVHRSVIHRLWNKYQKDQNASRRLGSGRRRITTMADDRYLLQCSRRRKTLTARQLASQLSAAAGRPISRQIVSCRLHGGKLFARRPAVCVPLSPAHVTALLHWAREHCSWTPEQWGHVIFTDESRFNIQNDSRRAMIWRDPGTRYRAPTSSKETITEVAGYLSGQG
ncbi:hypothetical protein AVEN_234296-1 [Araneus ventricosus]|uniref:Transposase Tc1-like domain-containing protein n=1 Tax=Araneus ventricosus TaxID=182803 RepID=A0A4Y2A8T9_ARAVE|nr:hypothetical protein AVEN_234296-1 [Araneus ventricosus]